MNISKYKYLNVFENLCKRTQSLYDYCRQLRQADEIKKLWTYNGVVHVKFDDNDNELPTKLYHPDDINEYFDDSFYNYTSMSSFDNSNDVSDSWWM